MIPTKAEQDRKQFKSTDNPGIIFKIILKVQKNILKIRKCEIMEIDTSKKVLFFHDASCRNITNFHSFSIIFDRFPIAPTEASKDAPSAAQDARRAPGELP